MFLAKPLFICLFSVLKGTVSGNQGHLRHVGEDEIPHKLFFPAADKLLQTEHLENDLLPHQENILNTIKAYREVWNEPEAEVYSLDNFTCTNALSYLDINFDYEFHADIRDSAKDDMCKLVALYHHGGYLFNKDVQVVDKLRLDANIRFVGVVGCDGRCIHSGFLASAPRHPLIKRASELLLEKYRTRSESQREDGVKPIEYALAEAYNELAGEEKGYVFLLKRLRLDHVHHPYGYEHEFYPHVTRQHGNGNCNIIYHDPDREILYFFENFVGTGGCAPGLIPRKMWFSFKTNILETKQPRPHYDNVMNTISEYRNFWGEMDAPVHFLDDNSCQDMIQEAYPALVPYFKRENIGAYKGDICRNAALYLHGGYYFDVDMLVVGKVKPRDASTFVSTLSCGGGCFFQAFIAATAVHPIVKGSLDKMLDIYQGGLDTIMIGPITMAKAYHEMQWPERNNDVELYEEMRLDTDGPEYKYYPHVPRQIGSGNDNCNFVVHDPEREVIFFFARFMGYGGCQPPPPDEAF